MVTKMVEREFSSVPALKRSPSLLTDIHCVLFNVLNCLMVHERKVGLP